MSVAVQPFSGNFIADRNHSSVQFTIAHMRVSRFRASFADVNARLGGDRDNVRLEGSVPVDSISIVEPQDLRDHVVTGEDFFDATRHPELRFRSSRVDFEEDGRVRVTGELELRGVTRPIEASGTFRRPVADPFGTTRGAIELTATIDRRAWGFDWQMAMPDGHDGLGWSVELDARLELVSAE
jgi:polyisoprenoid-binding protein YceI